MDPEAVKRFLQPDVAAVAGGDPSSTPSRLYDALVISGLHIAAAEPGRVLCSFAVSPRLACPRGYLQGGVTATLADVVGSAVFYSSGVGTSGVSVEISVSYVDAASIGIV